jgi:hypothetical protein
MRWAVATYVFIGPSFKLAGIEARQEDNLSTHEQTFSVMPFSFSFFLG